MKFFAVFLILAINGAVKKVQGSGCAGNSGQNLPAGCGGDSSSSQYTYNIEATRFNLITPPDHPVIYVDDLYDTARELTYVLTINDENPFIIIAELINAGAGFRYYVDGDVNLNACESINGGGWDSAIVSIVDKGVLPDGKCPVNDHTTEYIDEELDPITATFSEMINCGDYELNANLFRNDIFAIQLSFSFTIEDNCISN